MTDEGRGDEAAERGTSKQRGPTIADIEGYFARYGGSAERVDETSVQSSLSEGRRELPMIVTVDEPDYVYFRLFLFSNAELGDDTDYLRLMQISDKASVVKLAVDSAQELVACIEYPLVILDYGLFETTIDLFFGFIESFYSQVAEVVDN